MMTRAVVGAPNPGSSAATNRLVVNDLVDNLDKLLGGWTVRDGAADVRCHDRAVFPEHEDGRRGDSIAKKVEDAMGASVERQRQWDTSEGWKTREWEGGGSSWTQGRVTRERS